MQVFNRIFRRGRAKGAFNMIERRLYAEEARPFLHECLAQVSPKLLLFGGNSAVDEVVTSLGGKAEADVETIAYGPNGSRDAVYYCEYRVSLPGLPTTLAIGLYHPSKLNNCFYADAFPRLQARFDEALGVPMLRSA